MDQTRHPPSIWHVPVLAAKHFASASLFVYPLAQGPCMEYRQSLAYVHRVLSYFGPEAVFGKSGNRALASRPRAARAKEMK
eukprot:415541-Pelagomonas_calceolata.AAC.1